jgi:hypothetical protein
MDSIFPDTAIYGEVEAGRASIVRKHLMSLIGHVTTKTFDMAELLYEAQAHAYYLQWGYASLGEYAAKELGLKERKAQYLSRIVKVCRDVAVERKNYEPAGISKLREIATLDPDGFFFDKDKNQNFPLDEIIVDLILDAPDLSLQEIKDKVDFLKGQVGDNRQVVRSYGVTQSTWDNVIKPAMEMARKKLGSAGRDDSGQAQEYSDGACMEIICASFVQDPNNYMEEPDESMEQNNEDSTDTVVSA